MNKDFHEAIMSLESILSDLERHKHALNMERGLGDRLLDAAVAGVRETFDAERDPDGTPWPELSSDYARAKERLFPGRPKLVREGLMRSEEEMAGERTITEDGAKWRYGVTEQARDECDWNHQGDPARNRPPRRFVGFTEDSRRESRSILDDQLKGTNDPR